jgi:tRNA modification GTPase
LVAEELKMAQETLGEITGKVTSDELLGKIFGSFCIGK